MRHAGIAAVLLVSLGTSNGPARAEPKGFPKEAHGEWVGVSAEWAGKAVPKEIAHRMKVTIRADTVTVSPLSYVDDQFTNEGELTTFSYRIDPDTRPKAIDLTLKEKDGESRQLGIYDLDKGQLKLCWQHDGKQRPKEFKTVAEPTQMLLILKRSEK